MKGNTYKHVLSGLFVVIVVIVVLLYHGIFASCIYARIIDGYITVTTDESGSVQLDELRVSSRQACSGVAK